MIYYVATVGQRERETGRQREIETAFASGIAACDTVGRWWMPPCIVGLSVSDQNSFRAIQLKVKWKICKLCDSSAPESAPSPSFPSLSRFFWQPVLWRIADLAAEFANWLHTNAQMAQGIRTADWPDKKKKIYLLRIGNVMENVKWQILAGKGTSVTAFTVFTDFTVRFLISTYNVQTKHKK